MKKPWSERKPKLPAIPCKGCGKEFNSDRKATAYCSRSCPSMPKSRLTHPGYQVDRLAIIGPTFHQHQCKVCDKNFLAKTKRVFYCSKKCRERAQRGAALKTFRCEHCGKVWQKFSSKDVQQYCSQRCNAKAAKQHNKHIKRARNYGNTDATRINIGALIHRDKGICYHCKEPVHPREKVPHPLAPTRDHYIPMSKGGRHTWDNIVLCHFMCNNAKRDKVLPARMDNASIQCDVSLRSVGAY